MHSFNKKLLFRADANQSIGMGHVMRCLALAQTYKDLGGKALFLMASEEPSLKMRLLKEGIDVINNKFFNVGGNEDSLFTAEVARNEDADWVVLDGYSFSRDYQSTLKDKKLPILMIDDLGHENTLPADALPVVLPRHLVQDIDTEEDWEFAERMYKANINA